MIEIYGSPRAEQRTVCFRVAIYLLRGDNWRLWQLAVERSLYAHVVARAVFEGGFLDG